MLKRCITNALFFGIFLFQPTLSLADDLVSLSITGSKSHDPKVYTQGLIFDDQYLYESSGLYGRSAFFKRDFINDKTLRHISIYHLPDHYFAEGATLAEGEIYLLTWKEGAAIVLDPETLAVRRRLAYEGQGWGLAFDGERLWRSDGTNKLYPHRPDDFAPAGPPVEVFYGRRAVDSLNELEWDPATNLMLANVYGSDAVAVIDLADGQVICWLDARPLRVLARQDGLDDSANRWDTVLNGLALTPDGKSLWLTGKLWPQMYQVSWPPDELKRRVNGR